MLKTNAKLICIFMAIVLLSGLSAQASDKTTKENISPSPSGSSELIGKIELDYNTYTYEAVPVPSKEDKTKVFYRGRITIQDNENDKRVFYKETIDLDPRPGQCGEFPTITALTCKLFEEKYDLKIAVFCGSRNGGHKTLNVFRADPSFAQIKEASLNFGEQTPNLYKTKDGYNFMSKVFRRIEFPGISSGKQECLMFYRLKSGELISESELFAFVPWFASDVEDEYFKNYTAYKERLDKEMTNQANDKQSTFHKYAGSLLSSLVATQDKNRICSGLQAMSAYDISEPELQQWLDRVKQFGFPEFKVSSCKAGAK